MRHYGIGFIHQELNVLDNVDVAGNIFLGREPVIAGPLKLIDRRTIHAEAAKYMKRLGIDVPTTTRVGDLPIAYQQMVEIAKALSMNTRILLMDEPTSSLTLSETETLLKITKDLRAQGVSIIYISHRLSEVKEIADRVVALRDGRNAGGLKREEISHERMVKLMVGRDLIYRQPATSKSGDGCIEVRGLRTQRYPKQSVSFELCRGEIVGFAGLVGAGRSEVAQAIFGVDRPVGGEIVMNGKPLPPGSPKVAIREGIYLVPEDRRRTGLVTPMNIRENITLPALERYSSAGLLKFRKELEKPSASRKNCASNAPPSSSASPPSAAATSRKSSSQSGSPSSPSSSSLTNPPAASMSARRPKSTTSCAPSPRKASPS
jgi:ribose transport system ATP-binding protein